MDFLVKKDHWVLRVERGTKALQEMMGHQEERGPLVMWDVMAVMGPVVQLVLKDLKAF